MEVMTLCINKDTNSDLFAYHCHIKKLGLTHLVFADDLLLFCKGETSSIDLLMQGV